MIYYVFSTFFLKAYAYGKYWEDSKKKKQRVKYWERRGGDNFDPWGSNEPLSSYLCICVCVCV